MEKPTTVIPVKRDKTMHGRTHKYVTGCGNVYVTVNSDNGRPVELFIRCGKAGGCAMAFMEALARTISVALRCGVDTEEILGQYVGIECPGYIVSGGETVASCPSAVAMALKPELKLLDIELKGETVDGYKS